MSDLLTANIDPRDVLAYDLGLVEYGRAWAIQQKLHAQTVAGEIGGAYLSLEHPPVLTFGKNASKEHLLVPRAALEREGIAIYEIDRGGEVTAHNPGQLVVYPILAVKQLGLSPRSYVCALEKAVIELCSHYDVAARTDPINPGVWVGPNKICALGIRIKERVSMHGLALNVSNDLSLFGKIVPCGIRERGVTSLAKETGQSIELAKIAVELQSILEKNLDIKLTKSFLSAGLHCTEEVRIITS